MGQLIFVLCERCKKQAVVLIEGAEGEKEVHFAYSTLDLNQIGQRAVDAGLVESAWAYDVARGRNDLELWRLPQLESDRNKALRRSVAGTEFIHSSLCRQLRPADVEYFFGRQANMISCNMPDIPVVPSVEVSGEAVAV